MIDIYIGVTPVLRWKDLHKLDRTVSRLYVVTISPDTLTDAEYAEIALEEFHSVVPVNVVDDFNFTVIGSNGAIEPVPGTPIPEYTAVIRQA